MRKPTRRLVKVDCGHDHFVICRSNVQAFKANEKEMERGQGRNYEEACRNLGGNSQNRKIKTLL